MTLFVQNNAAGGGGGTLNPAQGAVDLGVIANGDTGLGLAAAVGNRQQVTYTPTLAGAPVNRLNALANTNFTPNYGAGAQAVVIAILPVGANFTLNDGTLITNVAGTALPPQNSGLAGANNNTTNDCLVIYDTSNAAGNGYCVARAGTGGTLDLNLPTSVLLYHELSHGFRIVNNNLLALTLGCNPSSPEENAAITDENDVRTQNANFTGDAPALRDPAIHCGNSGPCGGCCIVASVASGSPVSAEVKALRAIRDGLVRSTEVGFAFFERFFYDYYDFSPQVCTLMARRPDLSTQILVGFVRPLIVALRLLNHHAVEASSAEELGDRLRLYHPDRQEAAATLAALQRTRALWQGHTAADDAVAGELVHLLRDRASPSEHIRWGLLEPLRIYGEALQAYAAGDPSAAIGQALQQSFAAWAAEVPLDHIWASLSGEQLMSELAFYESRMLRPADARARFRRRLLERFADITAVRVVLGHGTMPAGGAS